jgi:hypothetical protein
MDKTPLLSIIFVLLVALAVSSPVRFSEAFESADENLEMTQTQEGASKKYYAVDKRHPIASWMGVERAEAHKRVLKQEYKDEMDSYVSKCCCVGPCLEKWNMLKPFSCNKCPKRDKDDLGYHAVPNDEKSALAEGAESVTAKGQLVLPLDIWHNACASGYRCGGEKKKKKK